MNDLFSSGSVHLTPKAKKVIDLIVEPAISMIVYNELVHVTFRAYARRRYGMASYHEFKRLFAEKGIDVFREPMERIHQLLEELNVRHTIGSYRLTLK
jgi:hypothetical protein